MADCKVADNIICLLKFSRNCPFYLFYLTWKEQSAVSQQVWLIADINLSPGVSPISKLLSAKDGFDLQALSLI